jgi:hypothetical protein
VTHRRVGPAVAALLATGLLAGCSGDDEPVPDRATASSAPSPRTPPPISPRTSLSFSPGATVPETLPPSSGTGRPIPIPSAPQTTR